RLGRRLRGIGGGGLGLSRGGGDGLRIGGNRLGGWGCRGGGWFSRPGGGPRVGRGPILRRWPLGGWGGPRARASPRGGRWAAAAAGAACCGWAGGTAGGVTEPSGRTIRVFTRRGPPSAAFGSSTVATWGGAPGAGWGAAIGAEPGSAGMTTSSCRGTICSASG